jgi:putative nucleotidyltransferase with HDIG domain
MTKASAVRPQAHEVIRLSWLARTYIGAVVATGAFGLILSISRLQGPQPDFRQFYYLLVLTVLSSFIPVKLPNVSANISVSETFVFMGTLLYGAAAGVPLVFIDALLICLQMARRHVVWHRLIFSICAPGISIWAAATVLFWVVRSQPLAYLPVTPVNLRPPIELFAIGMAAFTLVYFLLNSWLVAFAIALEQHKNPVTVWTKNFSNLWLNYAAGSSIAVLLVYKSNHIEWAYLFFVFPLLVVLFLTYRWTMVKVEQAERHVSEMSRTFLQTIEALAMAIDAKDQVTHGHIRRVQRYTFALAKALGVHDSKQLDAIRAAALLHDTGKLAVPEYILNKPGPLTPAEFERMKLHATIGADILKSIDFPYPVEPIVRHHHERWDGTGYPAGIRGTDIPLGARILSVVDCYDAITSDRPYRSAMTRDQAAQYLTGAKGTLYDPWVVDGFIGILDDLEALDAAEEPRHDAHPESAAPRPHLQVIKATRAEDREFVKLRRELPVVSSAQAAAETLFESLEPVVPVVTLVLYVPVADSTDLVASGCAGFAVPAIANMRVAIGDRVSGWVFANRTAMVNSEAVLELGPAARTSPVPLKYALVVPVISGGRCVGVVGLFGNDQFTEDHQRFVESATALLPSVFSAATAS